MLMTYLYFQLFSTLKIAGFQLYQTYLLCADIKLCVAYWRKLILLIFSWCWFLFICIWSDWDDLRSRSDHGKTVSIQRFNQFGWMVLQDNVSIIIRLIAYCCRDFFMSRSIVFWCTVNFDEITEVFFEYVSGDDHILQLLHLLMNVIWPHSIHYTSQNMCQRSLSLKGFSFLARFFGRQLRLVGILIWWLVL